jgi:hypothetical protein
VLLSCLLQCVKLLVAAGANIEALCAQDPKQTPLVSLLQCDCADCLLDLLPHVILV